MSIFTIYMGQRGVDGDDGDDGISIGDTSEYIVNNPLMHSFSTSQLSTNTLINYSADGNCSYIDRYGDYAWTKKREYTNFCQYSNDMSNWTDVFGLFNYAGTTLDPDGGNSASVIELTSDTSNTLNGVAALTVPDLVFGDIYTISFWVKIISGTVSSVSLALDTTALDERIVMSNPSSDWVRVFYQLPVTSSNNIWISPRGSAGSVIGIYGVSITDTLYKADLVETDGVKEVGAYIFDVYRYSNLGFLIEEGKENLLHHSSDLSFWELTDCEAASRRVADIFGYENKINTLSSVESTDISISSSSEALADTQEYTVSFFVSATIGTSALISIAGGDEVIISDLPSDKIERVSLVCIAGSSGSGIKIRFANDSDSYSLSLQYLQIELGEISSPILTGGNSVVRQESSSSASYSYNAPKPDEPWSFAFKQSGVNDTSNVKTVFSNGETGSDEFSLSFAGSLLTLNMGGNLSLLEWAGVSEYAITYDGTNVRFYNGAKLIKTQLSASTPHIANLIYFGYNGADSYINAYLSDVMFYDTALSTEDLKYLIGDK